MTRLLRSTCKPAIGHCMSHASIHFHLNFLVRAAGLEPAQRFLTEDLHTSYGFRRLAWARSRFRLVCGLDYTFTLAHRRFRC